MFLHFPVAIVIEYQFFYNVDSIYFRQYMQNIGKELSYEKSFDICGTCRFLPNGIRYHRGRRTGAVSSGYDHAAFYSKMHIFVLLGVLLSLFSRHIAAETENHVIHIICIAGIILPVLLWLYTIRHDPAGTMDYYFLVYFLYLGGYAAAFHVIIRNKH